ncbi:hypothetical protein PSHT_15324 [Puccinia striiformis]|uniref:DUF659 domain-containing protein n=1 Tax=Puccinia striiformis TaxID=27350 RepID=A0A2S4UFW8_9BASI|nr:hypothetical protein PSHT_15324 [Puccinia striiformis]
MTSTNRPKRHKNNTSRMSTSEPPDPNENNQRDEYENEEEDINENENENENKNKNEHRIDAPKEDDEASGGRRPLTDEEQLQRAQRTYNNSVSACYKSCGGKISRPTHDTSCGNLNKHVATCLRRQSEASTTQSLLSLGITATGLINPKEVPQLCAEAARPFQALVDASHKAILHPTVLKHLPTRKAVSKDIHLLYSAIQDDYRSVLKAHKGALYLGVDAWQSPNGFDILGIVIYRLKEEEKGDFELEAMPLDFVQLCESHSGEYMAQTICGIVSNNATNNGVMVRELKRLKWARFKGDTQWIRCFAHVLNLIVQGILRPFGTQKKRLLTGCEPPILEGSQDLSQASSPILLTQFPSPPWFSRALPSL